MSSICLDAVPLANLIANCFAKNEQNYLNVDSKFKLRDQWNS